jgi:hypothetical protein
MAFPNGVETVTVTAGAAGYRTLDGDPYTGTITFTPSVSRVTSATHGVIALGTVNATLSASGYFTETLLATDADDFSPTGWTYRVDEEFTNAPGRAYNISLPAATPTVALPSLAPVESSSGTVSSPAVLSVNGDTGVITGLLEAANNLSDLGSTATARTNLGLGGAAILNVGTSTGTVSAGDAVPTHTAASDPHGDRAYTDTQIAALSALTQTAVKATDETRTSTTAVSNDTHLFASLEANSVYRFTGMLLFDGPEAADAKISFTAPSGATGGWSPVAGTLGTTTPDGSAQLKMAGRRFGAEVDVGVMASSATLAGLIALPHGFVATGATAGTLRLQWAQSSSNATAVSLKAGSTLEVVKVSGAGPSASGINLDYPASYPSDQGLLAWTYDPDIAGHVTAQSSGGVGGRITLTKIQIRKSITWSQVWFGLSGIDTGASLSNCYLGVYNAAGTRVGVTADISADLMTGAVAKGISLTAPFTAAPGEYFIAMLLNGTWTTNVLHFKASGAGISVNANLSAPSLRYSNMLTGQTSLPASLDLTQQSTSIINTGWASQWYGVS